MDDQPENEASQEIENGAEKGQQTREPQSYRQVAAAHISTLNEINNQIPKMLKYFATALTQLTNNPIPFEHPDFVSTPGTLDYRKEAFRINAAYCSMAVDEIREELVKQINDLEKHKVIPKSHPKYTVAKRHGQTGKEETAEVVDPEKEVRNGGYGEFDVGVLNARANSGQVGGEDVLDRVKAILEDLKRQSEGDAYGDEMVVDG
jgi:hypothetical protein